MITAITHLTVVVEDTDEAIEWFTDRFGFELRADDSFGEDQRWVTVAPPGAATEIVLQEPDPAVHGRENAAEMRERIGGGTMTVLAVDDCRATVDRLSDRGVQVPLDPEPVPWGIHAIVEDCYGNPYNLVETRE